ncbi:MAG: divalent-cation tolerance protein CutA [Elusimicrobiota bacterium]
MFIVCLITVPKLSLGRKIADALVRSKSAACVNLLTGIESLFFWKGHVEKTRECLLIAKSTKKKFSRLKKTVERLHPYSVPEIIALPVECGNPSYLRWVSASVNGNVR